MSLNAILLIVAASILHVAWNLLGKRRSPSTAFFFLACGFGTLLLAPAVLWNWTLLTIMPAEVWGLLVVTGFCQALYFVGLASAYAHGHISVAYPIARALPVLLVAIASAVRQSHVDPLAWLGMALIVAGALLVPVTRFRTWHLRDYWHRSCFYALIAALGTAGYSITDDRALALFRSVAGSTASPLRVTLCYAAFEGALACAWLIPVIARHAASRANLRHLIAKQRGAVAMTGLGMYGAYPLVLLSMAYVDNVSYVVAFRQLSIPLAAISGVMILGEPAWRPKLIGVAIMFAGLILAALY